MKMNRSIWTCATAALATLFGCGSTPPVNRATQAVAASQPAPSRPFMVPEASLPDGFPAPGPVGMVLVKHYPACREARVESADGEGDSMFMSLFNHIKTNDIPMTAPVEMIWDKSATTQPAKPVAMAFVYGKPTTGKTGVDGKVHVIDLPAQTVISIGVRGGYDEKHFTPALAALKDFLADQSDRYEQTGPPRYLGYNSPFVPPFMRYGEVQLPIAVLK